MKNKSQSGQIVIILLLTMLVALTIGLVVTQRSVTDVTTSTQSEQSSRAFSAAEAGIEKAQQAAFNPNTSISDLKNESRAQYYSVLVPQPGQALEYPPIGKETIAQFWLADPDNGTDTYGGQKIDVYFGNADLRDNLTSAETPAIEINIITKDSTSGQFSSRRYYYDPLSSRTTNNGFTYAGCSPPPSAINTSNSPSFDPVTFLPKDRLFRCRVTVPADFNFSSTTNIPILLRTRILYSNANQAVALQPLTGSLLKQATIYTSRGYSGQSQKVIQVFKQKYVIPSFLDFAVFSAGNINKPQ